MTALDQALWAHVAAGVARELRETLEKQQTYVERSTGEAFRGALGTADPVLRDAVEAVHQALNMGKGPSSGKSGPEAILELYGKLEREGLGVTAVTDPDTGELSYVGEDFDPDALLELVRQPYVTRGTGKVDPQRWSDLTPWDAENVYRMVREARHLANEANEIEVDGKKADRAMKIEQLAEAAARNLPEQGKLPQDPLLSDLLFRRLKLGAQSADGLLLDIMSLAHLIDGGDRDGVAHQLFVDQYRRQREKREQLTRDFATALGEKFAKSGLDRERLNEKLDLREDLPLPPELARWWTEKPASDKGLAGLAAKLGILPDGRSTRARLIMIMLNMGNDGNKERMLGGFGWTADQVLRAAGKHLSRAELEWVNDVHRLLENRGSNGKTLWEEMAAVHERERGVPPEKIKAKPYQVELLDERGNPTGEVVDMVGGYFPAKYDPRPGSEKNTAERAEAKYVADFLSPGAGSFAPSVSAPHSKARAKHYTDVVNLDFGVVPAHVIQVVQDIAFRDYVRDVAGVILDRRFTNAMSARLGEERTKLFKPWLAAVANVRDQVPEHLRTVNWIWSGLRSGAAVASLGWSIPRAIGDLADPLIWLAARGGDMPLASKHLALATKRTMTDYKAARDFVRANSSEVRDRVDNQTHRLRHMMDGMGTRKGMRNPLIQGARDSAFVTMEVVDRLVTTPIWLAAYEMTMEQHRAKGFSEADAHELAKRAGDDAVREVLPPHDIADSPALIRDRRGLGSMLLFYGHANKIWNLYRRQVADIGHAFRSEEATVGDKVSAVARFAGTVAAVSIANGALSEWLSGRGQEAEETTGEWWARKTISALFYPFPFIGALGDAVAGKLITGSMKKLSIKNAPQISYFFQVLERLGKEYEKWQNGEGGAGLALQELLEAAAAIFAGAPTRQARDTLGYAKGLATGEEHPRGPFDVASGLAYGQDERDAGNPLKSIQNLFTPKK